MTTPRDLGRLDQPLPGAGFLTAIQRFYRNYAVFSGRASRSEYWWVVLFFVAVYAVLWAVTLALGLSLGSADQTAATVIIAVFGSIAGIVFLGSLVPSIAIQVRRLHDGNYSGGLYFLHLIPYIGSLVVLILTLMPSSPLGARFDLGAWTSPFPGAAPQGYPPEAPAAPPAPDDGRV